MLKDRKVCKKQLFNLISAELAKDGFNPKILGQSLYRKMPFGKWAFHLSFLDRVYGFEVMADVAVRLDVIEDIVNNYPLKTLLNNKERKNTFTVGTNFRTNGRSPIWEIEFEEEIPDIAMSIIELFRKRGLPFLEYNSSLKNVINTLKNDVVNGRRVLTAAFLLKNKSLFEEIAAEQKMLFENKQDFRLNDFLILEGELRRGIDLRIK